MDLIDEVIATGIRFRWKRAVRFWWQRRTRGWDDSDTWGLERSIALFALPRLRRYRELKNGFPFGMDAAEWDRVLGEIEWLLEVHARGMWEFDRGDTERYEKASELFGKHFSNLWW